MTEPQPARRDLARATLDNYKSLGARMATSRKKTKPRTRYTPRGNGRDPVGLGDLTNGLLSNWKPSMYGAQAVIRWNDYAGKAAALAAPERYDAETGTLHIRPVSPAAASALRWQANQLATAANQALGVDAVRHIRVLAPDPARTATPTALDDEQPEPTTTERPVVRPELPPVVHHPRQAMREARAKQDDFPLREQPDRHFATSRGSLREPEPPALEPATPSRGSNSDRSRQAALAKARAERASQTLPTALPRTA